MARKKERATEPRAEAPPAPYAVPKPVASLPRSRPAPFDLRPGAAACEAIASFLGIVEIRDMRFRGAIVPAARDRWRAEGRLTAELSQTCVVTLDPVAERIDVAVARDFVPIADLSANGEIDVDPDEDDEDDPDGYDTEIDLGALAIEILALSLVPYPRRQGTAPVEMQVTEPGTQPLTDADVRPFAALAALRTKMEDDEP
ncbi:MAG: YceD family protein [Pseudomonadota bacterium]